jgi:hypothetical protein
MDAIGGDQEVGVRDRDVLVRAALDEARADFAVRQLLDLGEMVAGPDPCVADRDLRDRNVDLVLGPIVGPFVEDDLEAENICSR